MRQGNKKIYHLEALCAPLDLVVWPERLLTTYPPHLISSAWPSACRSSRCVLPLLSAIS